MANYQKIASGSAAIVTGISVLVYTLHVFSAKELHRTITTDLYNRIVDEMLVKRSAAPRFCSGLSLIPTEAASQDSNNCFDDQGYRFVKSQETIRIYKPEPISLIAEIRNGNRSDITINYFCDQQTVSDFKEKFFIPNEWPSFSRVFNKDG